MKTEQRRKLIPVVIFGVLVLVAWVIKMNPPETEQRGGFDGPAMAVEVISLQQKDYRIRLESYGNVQPRTQSTLTAQVGGQIVSVNPNVRDGGFFDKGDVLASIDPRDYEANVRIAQAGLMDARQAMAEAGARSNQARGDWERLGNEGDAPELVQRLPQLEAAKARVISAESQLQKSRLELERTRIVAPFAGRILRKHADVGQLVSGNTPLADIYATDTVEIRLPIRNQDLGFIDLPETSRGEGKAQPIGGVTIHSDLIGDVVWDAKLVRTESAIDETSRQLHVIAQIDDPFADNEGSLPLKIGQYVTASLAGRELRNVITVPNTSIYQGTYVYVVEDELLQRRNIEVTWQNDTDAIIGSGLQQGDKLVTTSLGQVTSGLRVSIVGEESAGGRRAAAPGRDDPAGASE